MEAGRRIQNPRMSNPEQKQKAEVFRKLHTEGDVLLLANVWDVASARLIEDAGFPAIATSSAGIAFAQGFPDGQKIPPERMLAVIADIARAVNVPVTADVEAGYGNRPEDAALTARRVIEAGAVGMNFEDATGDVDHPLFDLPLRVCARGCGCGDDCAICWRSSLSDQYSCRGGFTVRGGTEASGRPADQPGVGPDAGGSGSIAQGG